RAVPPQGLTRRPGAQGAGPTPMSGSRALDGALELRLRHPRATLDLEPLRLRVELLLRSLARTRAAALLRRRGPAPRGRARAGRGRRRPRARRPARPAAGTRAAAVRLLVGSEQLLRRSDGCGGGDAD